MVSPDFDLSTLRGIPLFAGLSDEELDELRPALGVHKMGPGEVVVSEGDPALMMYVLAAGVVDVVKDHGSAAPQTIDSLVPVAFFGEMALVGDHSARSATVVTTEESVFLSLDRETFRKTLLGNPEIAVVMLEEAYRRLRMAREVPPGH
jgi:CRP-like cAMP-binding protein